MKGLTKKEKDLLKLSVQLWNGFVGLDRQHPSECSEFGRAIHDIQYLLAMRFVRRNIPNIFPVKNKMRGGLAWKQKR